MNLSEETTSPASPNASQDKSSSNFWKEFSQLALLALIIIVPFRLYIAQPFIVDGASMDPTFANGEYLIVDELSYRLRVPERGEVLVFRYPKDPCQSWWQQIRRGERSQCRHFIKRVIGLPGETVSLSEGRVTIANKENPEGFSLEEPYVKFERLESGHYKLGEKEYFVMGDNRLQSADSRLWGAVPRENIVGRPLVRFLPPAFFPGAVAYEESAKTN